MIELTVNTQNQPDLPNKSLDVMVDGSIYHLDFASYSNNGKIFRYNSADAKKLVDLLKQNVDKTLHFCSNWK
ncbi:hypothetical protein [Xenorhabdus szentirmaii]|uniref:DUF7823 domain-containing protein n=1 Tax=Xenorhabdus szentirmaii TaxID=290112 RepID=UPI0004B5C7F4|nr:hypothetical protein [Xenorhabdus szentirmaii]